MVSDERRGGLVRRHVVGGRLDDVLRPRDLRVVALVREEVGLSGLAELVAHDIRALVRQEARLEAVEEDVPGTRKS